MADVDHEQKALKALENFRRSLPYFAENCLRIRAKDEKILPLTFNTAQLYAHRRLQAQLKETGKVRAIFLKGRQQGISTYVGARYYRRASLNSGVNVYILAHEQSASDSLFSMVDRYHRNNPIAPTTGKSNAKELSFPRLDSMYVVATAGAKAGGRSRASSLFHGSEVAFWANASDHFASSVQTVPNIPGTEVILESTANGTGGEFYERWHEAVAGKSPYQAIFIPWFWQPEYQLPVPYDFELSWEQVEGELSEGEYMEMFGLSLEQMEWRRDKIRELRSVALFNQEYPATPALAFQSSDTTSYIKAIHVLRARKRKVEGGGPLIFGVDPAGEGGDRFAIAARRGHRVEWVVWRDKIGSPEAVDWLDTLIQEHRPARVNIDAGGIGSAVIGFLRAKRSEYALTVKSINFGARSQHKNALPHAPGPKTRREEMWKRMDEYLKLEEGVQIPDEEALQADMTRVRKKNNLVNDLQLETKDDIRARKERSPDLADAVALTFADNSFIKDYHEPAKSSDYGSPDVDKPRRSGRKGGWGGRNGWMGR